MMTARIAKEFTWEMSHRLPYHKAACKNIHGHSYKMRIELEGEVDEQGMVLDYYDIEKIVSPLVSKLDHCFICDSKDDLMIDFLNKNNLKYLVIDKYTTAENIVCYIIDELKDKFKRYENISMLMVRLKESADVHAEQKVVLK